MHRPAPPRFAQVGRPPPIGGEAWSRPLILLIAVGVFASFVSLVVELQTRERLTIVEVTFMEEEAAAAEAALQAPGTASPAPGAPAAPSAPATAPEPAAAP